jgi:hypothetical protein
MADAIALELSTIVARIRRAMPRNTDVMKLCDFAEEQLRQRAGRKGPGSTSGRSCEITCASGASSGRRRGPPRQVGLVREVRDFFSRYGAMSRAAAFSEGNGHPQVMGA